MRFPGLQQCGRLKCNEMMLNVKLIEWIGFAFLMCISNIRAKCESDRHPYLLLLMKQPECRSSHLSAAHFSKRDYAALWMHLFGTIRRHAFTTGWLPVQYNRVDLLSLTPAFRNVLNYPIPSLGSKPPPYLILHRCSRRKEGFFFP